MTRFIKEYANYKKAILEGFENNFNVTKYQEDIDRIVRLKERGMITTDETMKVLVGIDTNDYRIATIL